MTLLLLLLINYFSLLIGKCVVDYTEKGWFVSYIDRNPETIKLQESKRNKEKMDLDDEEKTARFIEQQIRKAAHAERNTTHAAEFTDLHREHHDQKGRSGDSRPGRAIPGQVGRFQARSGDSRPGRAIPGQVGRCQARFGRFQARFGRFQARFGRFQARSGDSRPGRAIPGQVWVIPGQVGRFQARSGDSRPGRAIPGQVRRFQARFGRCQARSGDVRPGHAIPGQVGRCQARFG